MRLNQCFQEKDWIQLRNSIEEVDPCANGNITIEPNIRIEMYYNSFFWLCDILRLSLPFFWVRIPSWFFPFSYFFSFILQESSKDNWIFHGRIESNVSVQKYRRWLVIFVQLASFFLYLFQFRLFFVCWSAIFYLRFLDLGLFFLDQTHDL